MPTIQNFEESRNRLPEAPPAIDIAPERFGKDAAALAQLGGEIGEMGGKLMQARKQAIESDAVASAQTEAMLEFSKLEDESRAEYQKQLASGNAVGTAGFTDGLRTKMESIIEQKVKSMPTGDAQRAYIERIRPIATRSYLGNLDWENQTRARQIIQNLDNRGNIVSQDIFNHPSLARTMDHIVSLREDINSKIGTVLDADQGQKVYKQLAKGYTASLVEGLANGTEADAKYGRELLQKLPPEMKELLDPDDLQRFSNRFDRADKERKQQFEIDKAAKKEQLQVQRDKAQDAILEDIYAGRSSVKDIISGKGAILDPDKKQTMLGILKARQNEPKVPSQENLRAAVSRIHADADDPTRITSEDQILKMYTRGELTWTQKQQAIGEFRSKNSVQGQVESDLKRQLFKQAESALVKTNSFGVADPDGQKHMAEFTSYALQEIERVKKEGGSVRDLLDANSKNYLGNAIRNYQRSPQEIMKAQVQKMKFQAQAKQSAQPPKPPQPDMVRVIDPSGKAGFIPRSNLAKALQRGFKESGGRSPQSLPQDIDEDISDSAMEAKFGGSLGDKEYFEGLTDISGSRSAPPPESKPTSKPSKVGELKTRKATKAEEKQLRNSKEDWGEKR